MVAVVGLPSVSALAVVAANALAQRSKAAVVRRRVLIMVVLFGKWRRNGRNLFGQRDHPGDAVAGLLDLRAIVRLAAADAEAIIARYQPALPRHGDEAEVAGTQGEFPIPRDREHAGWGKNGYGI